MRALGHLALANLTSFRRDVAAVFWTVAFPVTFMVLFGLIFSGGGSTRFTVGWVDLDGTAASRALATSPALAAVFDLRVATSEEEQLEAMRAGEVRAVIVIPAGFGDAATSGVAPETPLPVRLYTDPSNQQAAQTISGIVGAVVGGANQALSGRPPLLTVETLAIQSQQLSTIAFFVPSVLAMALMQLGLFGALPIVAERQNLILKRLAATPLRRRTFVSANLVTRLLVAMVQAAIILAIGALLFDVTLLGNPLVFAGLVALGALTFVALGYVIASFARTEDSASQLTSILQFPLMFLSGIFFPLEAMPDVLQVVALFLPLTYLGDALRQVMVNGTPLFPLQVDVIVLTAWMVGSFLVSARFFRWE
ncbi:MAG: transporter, permease protein [Chloroflexi bacterium]|nr:transporter, permease protein [Chloroflexota bacterium]